MAGRNRSAGNIASNGNITLSGAAKINGNARPSTAKRSAAAASPASHAAHGTAELSQRQRRHVRDVQQQQQHPRRLGDWRKLHPWPEQVAHAARRQLLFKDFSTQTGSILTFTGPTTIYCWGNFNMTSQTQTASNCRRTSSW